MKEVNGFLESFDHNIQFINEREKKTFAEQIVKEPSQNEDTRPLLATPNEIYNLMGTDGSAQLYKNMFKLFKISLLIPPSTANIERGFSVMNLLCTPIRSSLNDSSIDRLMCICINGPDMLDENDLDKLVDDFKKKRDNRRMDL